MTQKQMGPLLASAAVEELQRGNKLFNLFCASSLMRYFNNDWGEISQEDREMNDHGQLQFSGRHPLGRRGLPVDRHGGGRKQHHPAVSRGVLIPRKKQPFL